MESKRLEKEEIRQAEAAQDLEGPEETPEIVGIKEPPAQEGMIDTYEVNDEDAEDLNDAEEEAAEDAATAGA